MMDDSFEIRRERLLTALRREMPYPAFEPEDYLAASGSAVQALMACDLFLPRLVVVEGLVLLRQSVDDQAQRDALRSALECRDPAAVQRSFNRQELAHTFAEDGTSDLTLPALAVGVAESWRAWLAHRFPGRTFVVDIEHEDDGPVIEFWEPS